MWSYQHDYIQFIHWTAVILKIFWCPLGLEDGYQSLSCHNYCSVKDPPLSNVCRILVVLFVTSFSYLRVCIFLGLSAFCLGEVRKSFQINEVFTVFIRL